MQPAPSTRIPDGFMAAMRLEGEKPHQGLPGRNPALYQGPTVCNSTTALGLRGQAELNRVGSCSTGKERDTESGNDYFGARYYGSPMGRFLSPDPLLNSGRPSNPQTWNRFAYALNNPLRMIDPTGLYDISDDCQQATSCRRAAENLRTGVANLQGRVDAMKDGPEKTRLEASLKALGTENDGNGVDVAFEKLAPGVSGNTVPNADANGNLTGYTITLDPNQEHSGNQWAVDAAHEGTHVSDMEDPRFNNPATMMDPFQMEYRGYETSAWAAQALGASPWAYDKGSNVIWNSSWSAVDRQTLMDRGITNHVAGSPGHPENRIHDPWPDSAPPSPPPFY